MGIYHLWWNNSRFIEPNSKFYKWRHNNNQDEIDIINNLPENLETLSLQIDERTTFKLEKLLSTYFVEIISFFDLKLLVDIVNKNQAPTQAPTQAQPDVAEPTLRAAEPTVSAPTAPKADVSSIINKWSAKT